jgi:hypothetical protein
MDMRFGTWNAASLYRTGSLKTSPSDSTMDKYRKQRGMQNRKEHNLNDFCKAFPRKEVTGFYGGDL